MNITRLLQHIINSIWHTSHIFHGSLQISQSPLLDLRWDIGAAFGINTISCLQRNEWPQSIVQPFTCTMNRHQRLDHHHACCIEKTLFIAFTDILSLDLQISADIAEFSPDITLWHVNQQLISLADSLHGLRSWFKAQCTLANIPPHIAEITDFCRDPRFSRLSENQGKDHSWSCPVIFWCSHGQRLTSHKRHWNPSMHGWRLIMQHKHTICLPIPKSQVTEVHRNMWHCILVEMILDSWHGCLFLVL